MTCDIFLPLFTGKMHVQPHRASYHQDESLDDPSLIQLADLGIREITGSKGPEYPPGN